MGISVDGQKCPVCGGYMFDEDEIAFCPECGAPHHKACYLSLGHCALQDTHGTAAAYKRPEPEKQSPPDEPKQAPDHTEPWQNAPRTDSQNGVTVCGNCGHTLAPGQTTCPQCGAVVAQPVFPFGRGTVSFDPLGGVSPNATIEDIPVREVQAYVAVNTPRYIPRFKKQSKKSKLSWNWAAFLFPNAWFFYRKMYLPGVLYFLLTATASGLTMATELLMQSMPKEALKSYATITSYLMANMSSLNMALLAVSFAGVLASLVIRIIAGLTGDWMYRSSTINRIHAVKASDMEEDLPQALVKKGSVNPYLGIVGLFAVQWVVSLIYMFL